MKPRHSAALALVGWYFMIPPSTNERAPLPQWESVASYDIASDCQEALRKSKEQAQAEDDHPSAPPSNWKHSAKDWSGYSRWIAERFLDAQCISTDDPRLAK